MMRSMKFFVLALSTLSALPAQALDLFTFDGPQEARSAKLDQKPSSFKAKINPAAMQKTQETVMVNLPHKSIPAKQLEAVGDISERITPYAFESKTGSAVVNTNNGKFQSVVVFDQANKEVYKGTMQADGSVLFSEVSIDAYICDDFEKHQVEHANDSGQPRAADTSYYQSLTDLTFAQVTSLQSRPGASKVLYIDYLAGSVSGTAWNTDGGPAVINYDNYSYDNDASTFSLIDLQSMYAGWAEAAEDYGAFDVNVTTDLGVYNAVSNRNKSKIIATSTNWRGSGGVAYVGVFGIRNDDYYNIGWTFNDSFGSLGMTNSHESGHQMGLSHDGVPGRTYYGGAGNSGPIMGGPFGKDFVHWNKGDYPDANQPENDLEIIRERLGLLPDDYGNTNNTSSPITAQETVGFISPAGLLPSVDVDVLNFTLPATQNVDLTVRPLFAQFNGSNFGDNTAGGMNLSAKIELRDSSNTLIQEKLPTSAAANNTFNYSGSLAAGTYYLTVRAQAYSGANFNEYGNSGFYQVLYETDTTPAADLVVQSPAVSNAALEPGESFNFSATVRNQGSASANGTTLTYYRSSDATISDADVQVGTDAVSSLAINATSAENISLNAPAGTGSYYYGACVSNANGEINTNNNCSDAVQIVVSPAAASDLIVLPPSVDNDTVELGQAFTLSATVRNQGLATAAATELVYYRSTNSIISSSDIQVGTDPVASLGLNQNSPESINLTAPTTVGSYYYGACVTAVANESDTDNCSSAVQLTVVDSRASDLVVQSPSVSNNSLETGEAFNLGATVRNQGDLAAGSTTLTYYRSTNANITTSDTEVGQDSVSALGVNASSAETIGLIAPNSAGNYYYGACVATVSGEGTTDNNCSSAVLVSVNAPVNSDLVVLTPSVNNDNLELGQAFTLSATVRNQGSAVAAATELIYYRSTNATITSSDSQVGTDAVASLGINQNSAESIDLTAPNTVGSYYYGACVTAVTNESNTDNCSSAVLVTVVDGRASDLVVVSPSVSSNTVLAGEAFDFSATVRNLGDLASSATTLTYYRSTNDVVSTADTSVGQDDVGALGVGATSAETISLIAPASAGTYYYGGCVLTVPSETNTSNNCSTGVAVTVTLPIAQDSYEPDNSSASAKSITNGSSQTHSIHVPTDEDWLTITLPEAAENIVIETNGASGDDTRLWLYDSGLQELASNDDISPGITHSRITQASLPAGTYYIKVDEFNNDDTIESYTISFSADGVSVEEDQLCIPIKTNNGKLALICL